MQKLRLVLGTLLLFVLLYYLSLQIYPTSSGFGNLQFSTDKSEIISKAIDLAAGYGLALKAEKAEIRLQNNTDLIRDVQEKFGLGEGNELLRHYVPAYWWNITWNLKGDSRVIRYNNQDRGSDLSKHNDQEIEFKFDTFGDLIYLNINKVDSSASNRMTYMQAKDIVIDFVGKHTSKLDLTRAELIDNTVSVESEPFRNESEKNPSQQGRRGRSKSFQFKWEGQNEKIQKDIEVEATVSGNQVTGFSISYALEGDNEIEDVISAILQVLFVIITGTIILVLAFKKSRAYEIRFQLAAILGFMIFVLYGIELLFLVDAANDWLESFLHLLGPLFAGGVFVVCWAVAESVGRESWREKFIPLDLLIKGYLLHSKLGEGLLRGFAIGVTSLFLYLGLTWFFSRLGPISAFPSSEYIQFMFATASPALYLLSHSFWSDLFLLSVNFLLIMTLLYKKTGHGHITIILAAVPLAIVGTGQILPLYWGLLIKSIAMSVILWGFYRYNIFTAFTALLTYRILEVALSFSGAGESFLYNSWLLLAGIFVIACIYAVVTLFTRDAITDFTTIEPALARVINERQRMQQELKIARDVQMSFLPTHIPMVSGLDIASQCIPAQDVGGDYYDFVKITAKQIGVVIGDVSGKGTRAAFYMTLVKGFLKALSRTVTSPADLLKELNILFFENAKRDAFISMAYGVFNMKNNTLTLARSGHNPVILFKKSSDKIDVIRTEGLALGLEKGSLFNKLMQEIKINLETGDIVLFYTDGLTEARNKDNEEFGEEKLQEALKNYSDLSAEDIIQKIYQDVNKFSKSQIQHDDMSAVVVKVV